MKIGTKTQDPENYEAKLAAHISACGRCLPAGLGPASIGKGLCENGKVIYQNMKIAREKKKEE